ncbi:MAG: DUF108 domain-containing protein, partial [Chloroflexi bacterium]|nr:DUF108 domain-containing protein [Chloroflexota bacterium]
VVKRVVFQGGARDGARQLPTRLNVAATAALAAGHDVDVTLLQEAGQDMREIVLAASGAFGEFSARMRLRPREEQLGHIVALSLLATLRRLQELIQIG